MMNLQQTLLAYGEWLDGEGLMSSPDPDDGQTHQDLVNRFIDQWHDNPHRAPLVGE